jgi:hypothetical protein
LKYGISESPALKVQMISLNKERNSLEKFPVLGIIYVCVCVEVYTCCCMSMLIIHGLYICELTCSLKFIYAPPLQKSMFLVLLQLFTHMHVQSSESCSIGMFPAEIKQGNARDLLVSLQVSFPLFAATYFVLWWLILVGDFII